MDIQHNRHYSKTRDNSPKNYIWDFDEARALQGEGLPYSEIATKLNVPLPILYAVFRRRKLIKKSLLEVKFWQNALDKGKIYIYEGRKKISYCGQFMYAHVVWNINHPDDLMLREHGRSTYCIHHIDFSSLNDDSTNLIKITHLEHRLLHTKITQLFSIKKIHEMYEKGIALERLSRLLNIENDLLIRIFQIKGYLS